MAATYVPLQEAEEFPLGLSNTVYIPHSVLSLVAQKIGYWLTSSRPGKYQAILLDNPNIILKTICTLNPATLLSSGPEGLKQYCIQIIAQVSSSHQTRLTCC